MSSTDDDTMLDEAWLAAPRKRSRFRLVTAAALVAALCFLGGALTQKNLGADDAAAAGPGGLPSGIPEGLGGGLPDGFPGAGQQGSGAPSGGAGADVEDGEDEVIGTVVEKNGDVWVVEDLGGTRHDVTVTRDTRIVREARLTPARVTSGDRVQITGVSRDDQLQAADITLR